MEKRVNEIDLLRFLAALAVVFFHYSFRGYAADDMSIMPYPLLASASKYGYLGVELFFMISGFVILMTAADGDMRGFLISRIVRIFPSFWVCCTLTFIVAMAIGAPRYSVSVGQYLINMIMLSDFLGVPYIDGAYWSLYVELRFYGLVAIMLAIGWVHKVQKIIVIWLAVSVALEVMQTGKLLRYFLITNYSAFFCAGAACFLMWSKGVSPARVAVVVVSWGLAMLQSINALVGFERHYETTMNAYIVAGIITTFFVVMVLVALRCTGSFARKRWFLIGPITYPLYLLHQNIGFMVFNATYPKVNAHVLLWGGVFVILFSSCLIHIFVEKRCSILMKTALNAIANKTMRAAQFRG